jgi:uncharacterized protein (TIGR00251 family)
VATYLSERNDGVMLRVHVQTRASTDTIVGPHSDKLKIRITAAPVAGAANKHLLKFLAKKLKVPQGHLYIRSGAASTTKLIVIRGISAAKAKERLE